MSPLLFVSNLLDVVDGNTELLRHVEVSRLVIVTRHLELLVNQVGVVGGALTQVLEKQEDGGIDISRSRLPRDKMCPTAGIMY